MIYIDCIQGTEEWLKARAGVITASKFSTAVERTKKGERTSTSINYAAQVALERISGEPCNEDFVTWQMKRGTQLEEEARIEYECLTKNLVTESGIYLTDDKVFGYSSDGLIDEDGLIEIKCPASASVILNIWKTRDISDYIHQIQGGLWITMRKWCDFIMYAPQLRNVNKQLYYQRIYRDEDFIENMEEQLLEFSKTVSANEQVFRNEV